MIKIAVCDDENLPNGMEQYIGRMDESMNVLGLPLKWGIPLRT